MQFLDWFVPVALGVVVGLESWSLRRSVKHGEDMAVIREQLTPAGAPALRARVDDHEHRITIIEQRHAT